MWPIVLITTALFSILKLLEVVDWPWYAVLSPVLAATTFVVLLCVMWLWGLFSKSLDERLRGK